LKTRDESTGERTSGVRAVLSLAPAYRFAQNALGAQRFRDALTQQYIRATADDRVIDVGCGTADILDHLPDLDYLGFDPSDRYVADARSRFGARAQFVTTAADVAGHSPDRTLALAVGVLHHMDDNLAASTIALAARTLVDDGRMVTIDPTIIDGQPRVARLLAEQDRGRHVRGPEATKTLFDHFAEVKVTVRHDLLRVPYSHVIVEASEPRRI
jgi:SAM-dependent methyltransferase